MDLLKDLFTNKDQYNFWSQKATKNKGSFMHIIFLVLIMTLITLSGCGKKNSEVMRSLESKQAMIQQVPILKKSDKVALLLPLSGRHKNLGDSLQKAAEMSLFDHADDRLNVAMYDTKSTPLGARIAAQKAITEGAGLIIGPIFSNHVSEVSQVARHANINVISFSNNKSVANAGVFTLGFTPEEQIQEVFKYALERGKKSFAVMLPRNSYGSLVEKEIKLLQRRYEFMVDFIPYTFDSNQLVKDLNPLKTLSIDALFIPEGGRSLSKIVSALLYQEIPLEGVQFLGTGQWDEGYILENKTLHGAWIASANPQERFAFTSKYKTAYGAQPDRLATLAYDAISMLAILKRHHGEQAFSTGVLTQPRGFNGVDGLFRLRQNGSTERKLSILSVTPTRLVSLQNAPDSF